MRSKISRAACALVAHVGGARSRRDRGPRRGIAEHGQNVVRRRIQGRAGAAKERHAEARTRVAPRLRERPLPERAPARTARAGSPRWRAALPSLAFAAKGTDGHGSLGGEGHRRRSGPHRGPRRQIDPDRPRQSHDPLRDTGRGPDRPVDRRPRGRKIPHRQRELGEADRARRGRRARPPVPVPIKSRPSPRGSSAAWVVASLATFGILAVHGTMRRSDLKSSCYGHCTDSDVSSVKTEFAIGDAALGVGIVSTAISSVLFLSNRNPEHPPTTAAKPHIVAVDVSPTKTGTTLGLTGQF